METLLATNAHQMTQWTTLLTSLSSALKELGDIANWTSVLESTAATISSLSSQAEASGSDLERPNRSNHL